MEYTEKSKHHRPQYKSLFWPMILIGVGSAWLLLNLGIFTGANISVIFQLWPLLLVAIGVDLLFGRTSPSRGASIGLAFVGFVLAIMYVGPSIGLGSNPDYQNTTFDVPLDGTDHMNVNIDAGLSTVLVNPLVDSNSLIEGNIWHIGELRVDVSTGDNETEVTIAQQDFSFGFDFGTQDDANSGWNININPDVPLAIDFDGGVGSTIMDLSVFHLTGLTFDLGVGKVDITLPPPQESYGAFISGGVGEAIIDIPDDVAVKVIASTGIGNVELPLYLIQVEGDDSQISADGVWQTQGFDQAEQTILIEFDGGVGSLIIH